MNRIKIVFVLALLCLIANISVAQSESTFQLPEYRVEKLDNGMTVYLMERTSVPLIYVTMVFDAGAVRDGKSYGLANLTADSLLFGAGEMSKDQIEETVDFYGASLGTGGGLEAASLSATFASEDKATFLPLIRDVVTAPSFNEEEFGKHRFMAAMQLQRAKESPNAVIGDYFSKLMYGEHPYGNPENGTVKTLQAITLDQVKEFYATYYRPETTAIVISGKFDGDAMLEEVNQLFGGWQASTEAPPALDLDQNLEMPSEAQVLLIDKPDSIQTTFVIGAKGVTQDNPDSVAISLVNTILGGRFTSWLNSELRIKTGLTYGARSSFDSNKAAGTFSASSFTATATTEKALDLAVATLKRLHTDGIDAETLQSGKNYLKGNFPRGFESPGQLAGFLVMKHIYGIDDDYINKFAQRLDAINPEEVKTVINKYFPADSMQFVLAGKAEDIRELAAKYGEVTEVSIISDDYISK
jgi:zinc protease